MKLSRGSKENGVGGAQIREIGLEMDEEKAIRVIKGVSRKKENIKKVGKEKNKWFRKKNSEGYQRRVTEKNTVHTTFTSSGAAESNAKL